jgi:hypothetical protein
MSSPLYSFILLRWIQGVYSAEKVQSFVPAAITQEECDTILATPQGSWDAIAPGVTEAAETNE